MSRARRRSTSVGSSGPVALLAYGDESQRLLPDGNAIYLMAAAVVRADVCEPVRDVLRALLLRGQQRLHWRDEDRRRRLVIVAGVAACPAEHLVVVGSRYSPARQERARRRVLERLLWELDQRQVEHLLLESRHPERDRHDLTAIGGMRNAQVLSRRLRVDHGLPTVEPLLWLADAVCGAIGDDRCGQAVHLATLKGHVHLVEVDAT